MPSTRLTSSRDGSQRRSSLRGDPHGRWLWFTCEGLSFTSRTSDVC